MLPESSDHPNPKDLTQNQAEGESSQQAGKEGEEKQKCRPTSLHTVFPEVQEGGL